MVPPGDTPHMAKISDLNMLAMMGGRERTEAEWREYLTAAGFADIALHHTGTPFQSSRQQRDSENGRPGRPKRRGTR